MFQEIKGVKEPSASVRHMIKPDLIFYKNCAHGEEIHTESYRFRLNLYGFYLVILLLGTT